MSDKLTIDFGISGSLSAGSRLGGLPLGERPPTHIALRHPWDKVNDHYYKDLNLVVNLNPDPKKIEDYNNKKLVNKILLNFIDNEKTVTKAIGVYEWGKYGTNHGKLHYHFMVKVTNRKNFEDKLSELFNERYNLKCRTITSKVIKDVDHRNTYIKYMKKEQQNKIKCLFVKNI